MKNPILFRTALANIFKRSANWKQLYQTDVSVTDFANEYLKFWNKSDREYVLNTYIDAMIRTIYSGDINELSAKCCTPFAE